MPAAPSAGRPPLFGYGKEVHLNSGLRATSCKCAVSDFRPAKRAAPRALLVIDLGTARKAQGRPLAIAAVASPLTPGGGLKPESNRPDTGGEDSLAIIVTIPDFDHDIEHS